MKHRLLARAGASCAASALAVGGSWLLISAPATAVPTTKTFEFTKGSQTFEVPANVCQVTVDVLGAAGGAGSGGVAAGLGGRATATIVITPGETLEVNAGGAGGDGTKKSAGVGGFNGGADGGFDVQIGNDGGGGGGGASDVRRGGTALSNRVIVAGGGGGGGGDIDKSGVGGDGGGLAGKDGEPSSTGTPGGGGGTQSAGGAGGNASAVIPGTDGAPGSGGVGGAGDPDGGGGGGGGLFGGGGGAGSGIGESGMDDAGGGGGGSGFGPSGVAFETGVRKGDGLVTITFDPDAGGCPPAPQSAAAPEPVAAVARFTG